MTHPSLALAEQAEKDGKWGTLAGELQCYFNASPTLQGARNVLRLAQRAASWRTFKQRRVYFLRTFTTEPLAPFLCAQAALYGVELSVAHSAFNAYAQEVLSPDGAVYRWNPDVCVLTIRTADILPRIATFGSTLPAAEAEEEVNAAISLYDRLVTEFRKRSAATLLIHNLEASTLNPGGIMERFHRAGLHAHLHRVNSYLRDIAGRTAGVSMVDYDGVCNQHGTRNWVDQTKWLTARMPCSSENLPNLANEYLRHVMPAIGEQRKVIVVDLDNTLWGGIVGEDGSEGLRLGNDYPGFFYRQFQQALLHCTKRGIILAVCSKNNPEDAMEVLQHHRDMVLRPQHFAAMRIGWQPKQESVREIARELNVGIDSIVFLDDNPAERSQMREALPEVHTPEMPGSPELYAALVLEHPLLERLTLTDEDSQRSQQYAIEAERRELRETSDSVEDYLSSLRTVVTILPADCAAIPRVAQLTQKTNQFNLTTVRYTEQDIERYLASKGVDVYTAHAADRFGNHGMIGVLIVRVGDDGIPEIDTLLMSCRVIGRGVETALIASAAANYRDRQFASLRGRYIPTPKNEPAREFFPKHGFDTVKESASETLYSLALDGDIPCVPHWIECQPLPKEKIDG